MTLTKKQIAAIQRVIINCASDPRHKDTSGEAPVSDGIIITDGHVLLHAPESLGFKQQNKSDSKSAERMNKYSHAAFDDYGADFYRVEEPIPNGKSSSKLRAMLKEHTFMSDDGQHVVVSLSSHNTRGDEVWSAFDYGNLINAFEAVGKDAVAYIGNSTNLHCPEPYLIVEPEYDYGNMNKGIHAVVMPCRTSRRKP